MANAVDGTQAKYLNFDSANDAKTSGFVVTPSLGATVITGVAMQSANDAPDRDPKAITIEGSNDDTADWTTGTWTQVYKNDAIPAWSSLFTAGDRYQWQYFYFANNTPFKRYRWTVVHTQGPSTCCMQTSGRIAWMISGGRPPNKVVDDPGAKPRAPKLELFARGSQVN